MDKELDENLKAITLDAPEETLSKTDIEQIKAAFKEAGYVKPDFAPYYVSMIEAYLKAGGAADCVLMSRNDFEVNAKLSGWQGPDSVTSVGIDNLSPPDIEYDKPPEEPFGEPLMNGAYWLDRFTKELGTAAKQCEGCSCDAIEAAKRAAGIK